jgi:hypothetical protein
MLALAPAIAGIFGFVATAAEGPVAVVEDVRGAAASVGLMDYVAAGQVIKLGAKDTIVLGYLSSCWRETITGGTIVVGEEKSAISEGKVQRTKVDCDSRQTQLAEQVRQGAGTVFRGTPQPAPQPQLTIYGLSPLVEVKGGGSLIIERIDQPGERYEAPIGASSLLRGKFYDFAKSGQALTPEGIYIARLGGRQIVFKVDGRAKPGATPVVGRLMRVD